MCVLSNFLQESLCSWTIVVDVIDIMWSNLRTHVFQQGLAFGADCVTAITIKGS